MNGQPNFIEDVHSIYTLKGSKAFQGFEINRTLFEGKSQYQDIAIYENDALGRVLTLDGIIQITECDEFVYQEMMAHVPIFSHENATKTPHTKQTNAATHKNMQLPPHSKTAPIWTARHPRK